MLGLRCRILFKLDLRTLSHFLPFVCSRRLGSAAARKYWAYSRDLSKAYRLLFAPVPDCFPQAFVIETLYVCRSASGSRVSSQLSLHRSQNWNLFKVLHLESAPKFSQFDRLHFFLLCFLKEKLENIICLWKGTLAFSQGLTRGLEAHSLETKCQQLSRIIYVVLWPLAPCKILT